MEAIKPVLTVRTWIVAVREVAKGNYLGYGRTFRAPRAMRVAVIPFGYEDGLDVRLSNRGWVAIRGQRAPIVGRVSMDQTIIDVSHLPDVKPGEEVELLGPHVPASELARLAGFDAIEPIFTGLSKRVARVFLGKDLAPGAGLEPAT